MPPAPLVVFSRGTVDESVHYGSIAVADASGRLLASVGDPERITIMRSTAKPFQAMAVIETGAADQFAMTPEELALVASSHSGQAVHTEAVRRLLDRAGLSVDELQCGVHPPLHGGTREEMQRRGEAPSALHHNCSGKHCGMLCACVARGWDRRTYVRPDHPLQRAVLQLIADVVGVPAKAIGVAIDGCGVPTFALALRSIAQGFAHLAAREGLGDHEPAARRVREAMLAYPDMVAGEGRLDTDLVRVGSGRILAKAGAEACHGVALVDRGVGVALKVEDGGARAVPIAVVEVLRQLDALTEEEVQTLSAHARPVVRNYRREIVGEGRPAFFLDRR